VITEQNFEKAISQP